MPKAPPSLNSVPGRSHSQVEDEDRRRRLEQVLRGLPLRPVAESKVIDLARDLDEAFLLARAATAAKHKTRSASLSNMKRQLHCVETGASTLAKRLKDAHPNVINAWVDAERAAGGFADRQEVLQEWLRLKRLLKNTAIRAKRARNEAVISDSSEKRGRPLDQIADLRRRRAWRGQKHSRSRYLCEVDDRRRMAVRRRSRADRQYNYPQRCGRRSRYDYSSAARCGR